MRRALVIVTALGVLGLAACGGGGGSGDGSGSGADPAQPTQPTGVTAPGGSGSITDPIQKARDAVARQNQQLQQEEQRSGSADPTSP
jgi:hypothetical protein